MADMTDWYDDFISGEKTDEEIVELADIVEQEKDPSTEDIIELTDIVEDQSAELDLDSIKEDSFEAKENLELEDDISFKEELELEIDDPVDEVALEPSVVTEPATELSVTQEQLEAALERVIEKKFADKIDRLLMDGMEKAIKKEIVEIKERLLKDFDQMENV
jgi:hypothetical protein